MTDHETWSDVLNIINKSGSPVVVVSATAKTTRALVEAAYAAADNKLERAAEITEQVQKRHETIVHSFFADNGRSDQKELMDDCIRRIEQHTDMLRGYLADIADIGSLSLQSRDAVAGIGEQISSYLLAKCGEAIGMPTRFVDARDIIKTDSTFGSAVPDMEIIRMRSKRISELVKKGQIPVTGGFIGENELGELTTLGFEGSDYTASILGNVLDAENITIWTDVSGIYTCDPRIIPNARPIPEISFQEATELAYFGAKVLHPSTLKPAEKKQIPLFVKNLFEPDHPGTRIDGKAESNGPARALSYREKGVEITVTSNGEIPGHQFLTEIFSLLDRYHIPVDVVNTTEASVIIATEEQQKLNELTEQFRRFGSVQTETGKGFITVIGLHPDQSTDTRNRIIGALSDTEIDLISYSRSKKHLTIVVSGELLIDSVRGVHQSLFETE